MFLKDQVGPIRLAKLTEADGGSPLRRGRQLFYTLGAVLEVKDADTDPLHDCGKGINLCTLDFAVRHWQHGNRIMLCEFAASDIAAIPVGQQGTIRVFRCTVVGEKNLVELGLIKNEG